MITLHQFFLKALWIFAINTKDVNREIGAAPIELAAH